jgi:hypothetical protein
MLDFLALESRGTRIFISKYDNLYKPALTGSTGCWESPGLRMAGNNLRLGLNLARVPGALVSFQWIFRCLDRFQGGARNFPYRTQ